jgi:sensor domain CHASE-containing protein
MTWITVLLAALVAVLFIRDLVYHVQTEKKWRRATSDEATKRVMLMVEADLTALESKVNAKINLLKNLIRAKTTQAELGVPDEEEDLLIDGDTRRMQIVKRKAEEIERLAYGKRLERP